jgi:predicted Zn-dependent protease
VPLAASRVGAPKLDRAEVRRRIEVGAPGTYIIDMLADADSMLTRWPERTLEPVRVWVQRSAPLPDWTPEIAQSARSAFTEWGEVGFPVRFSFTVDSVAADIRVTFTDRVTDKNQLGITTHRHDQDGWIVSADIAIATHDTAGAPLPPALISGVARHEVGHALGLAHSKDRATIMYPESYTVTITGPDRATVKLLYTLPPGSVK